MNDYQEKLSLAISKVYKKLSSMSDEEFAAILEKHIDSNITNALLAMGECSFVSEPVVENVGWDVFNEEIISKDITDIVENEVSETILFKYPRKCTSVCTGFGDISYSEEILASSDDYSYDIAA